MNDGERTLTKGRTSQNPRLLRGSPKGHWAHPAHTLQHLAPITHLPEGFHNPRGLADPPSHPPAQQAWR